MWAPRAHASQSKPGASVVSSLHRVGLSDRRGSRLETESRWCEARAVSKAMMRFAAPSGSGIPASDRRRPVWAT